MSEGAVSSDRVQQARDNIASRRQSGLEPRAEDLRVAQQADQERADKRERAEVETERADER